VWCLGFERLEPLAGDLEVFVGGRVACGPRFLAAYAGVDEATVRRARGHAALKSLFLMLMGQNGDRGLPGGKPAWGPAGRVALDRVLSERLTPFRE
jgi:hypothetical protein